MTDENTNSVTIKYGKDYDDPWHVVYGDIGDIKRQLVEAYGIEDSMSFPEAVAQAASIAQGTWKVVKKGGGLGGTVISTGGSDTESPSNAPQTSPEASSSPYQGILEEIAGAKDVATLQAIYAKHNSAFKESTEIQNAFKLKRSDFN